MGMTYALTCSHARSASVCNPVSTNTRSQLLPELRIVHSSLQDSNMRVTATHKERLWCDSNSTSQDGNMQLIHSRHALTYGMQQQRQCKAAGNARQLAYQD